MIETMHRCPIRLLAYRLMPNHWQMRMAKKLRLEFTLRPRGKPRKEAG